MCLKISCFAIAFPSPGKWGNRCPTQLKLLFLNVLSMHVWITIRHKCVFHVPKYQSHRSVSVLFFLKEGSILFQKPQHSDILKEKEQK